MIRTVGTRMHLSWRWAARLGVAVASSVVATNVAAPPASAATAAVRVETTPRAPAAKLHASGADVAAFNAISGVNAVASAASLPATPFTERVSVSSAEAQATGGPNDSPSISSDGRYVAFASQATNLIAGDTNGVYDVFVRDRVNGTTERVSVGAAGVAGDGDSQYSSISADGRYVAFCSVAKNLVASDKNRAPDIFVRDRVAGTTTRVSTTSTGGEVKPTDTTCFLNSPVISADGNLVAFPSTAPGLVSGDTNGILDSFVKNRVTGAVERLSVNGSTQPTQADYSSYDISADNRYVVFAASLDPAFPQDTNVYRRDRTTGTNTLVSTNRATWFAAGGTMWDAQWPSMSANGRYVAYQCLCGLFYMPGGCCSAQTYEIFVKDLTSGDVLRVPRELMPGYVEAPPGFVPTRTSSLGEPILTDDGALLAFQAGSVWSQSDNPLYAMSLVTGEFAAVSIDANGDARPGTRPAWAQNGGAVAFLSTASTMVPADTNAQPDVFVTGVFADDGPVLGDDAYGGVIGGYTREETDISVAGAGPELAIRRTYNSGDHRNGAFGTGWSFNYGMSWRKDQLGHVVVAYPDGRQEVYTPDGAGGYTPPSSYAATLTASGAGFVVKQKDGTSYTFGSSGRLDTIGDANAHTLTLMYTTGGLLETVRNDTNGRTLTLTWDGAHVASVSTGSVAAHSGALTWRYYYSASQPTAVCDPRDNASTGSCRRYVYTDHLLTTVTQPKGNNDVVITYNSADRMLTKKDGAGTQTTYTYPDPRVVVATDGRTFRTTTEYDLKLRIVSTTDHLGNTTSYTYDTNGFRDGVTDPNLNTVSMDYDARGNLLSRTDGENKTSWYEYDANGNLRFARDARSASSTDNTYRTEYRYDVNNNLLERQSPPTPDVPAGATSTWTYTTGTEAAIGGGTMPAGLVRTERDARLHTTTYSYDAKGDLRETLDRAGLRKAFGYDEIGRRTSETQFSDTYPAGVATTFGYDVLSSPARQTYATVTDAVTGTQHRLQRRQVYDANGNLAEGWEEDLVGPDPDRVTLYGYDDADRLASRTDPELGAVSRTFDAAGNVRQVVDPNGTTYEVTYDERNLPTKVTAKAFVDDPVAGSPPRDVVLEQAAYDAGGRKKTELDALGRTRSIGYDHADRVLSVTLKDFANRDGTLRDVVEQTYGYDAAGHVTAESTGNGTLAVTHAYDAAGQLTRTTTDPAGTNRVTTFVRDANGNVLSETTTNSTGSDQTRYAYDVADRVASSTRENGATDLTTTRGYDYRGILATVTDARGNAAGAVPAAFTTTYTHDQAGNLTRVAAPAVPDAAGTGTVSPVTQLGYDTFGDRTSVKDARLAVTSTAYDRLGRVTGVTYPAYTSPAGLTVSPAESYGYDAIGNLTRKQDRRGKVTDYLFDRLSRVVRQQDPLVTGQAARGEIRYAYDDASNLTRQTDQRGAVTQYTYDAANRRRSVTDVVRRPGLPNLEYTAWLDHDDLGNETTVEDATGRAVHRAYSATSDLLSETDALLKTKSWTYDVASRPLVATDALNQTMTKAYDPAGRLVGQVAKDALGATVSTRAWGYDAVGNQTSETTPRLYTTTRSYDALNRMLSVVQPVTPTTSLTTAYGYDAGGNRVRLTDGRQNTTTYTFNPWNLPERTVEPSTAAHPALADRTFATSYDGGGLAVRDDAPGGVSVTRAYDELARLTSEVGTGATAASRAFGYDLAGNLTNAGADAYTYDDRGALTGATGPAGTSAFSYDGALRMTARTDVSGTTTFTYDARGLLDKTTEPFGDERQVHTYDDAGQLTEVRTFLDDDRTRVGNRTFTYDAEGRVTHDWYTKFSSGGNFARYDYTYYPDGALKSRFDDVMNLPGERLHQYDYDQAGRISSWTKPDGSTTTYDWDGAGNRVRAGTDTYTYDERNRLTSGAGTTYDWTARGTLAATTNGGTTTPYDVDALGRMTTAGATQYTYDSLDRITTRGGVAFGYAGRETDPVFDGTTTYSRTAQGDILSMLSPNGGFRFAGLNRHGDVAFQASYFGAVDYLTEYDPFGGVYARTGLTTQPTAGFQGDFTDPASGNVLMGSRWYTPGTGTFASRDTHDGEADAPATLNRYTYANGDPLDFVDPDGLCGFSLSGLVDCAKDAGHAVYSAGQYAVNTVRSAYDATVGVVRQGFDYVRNAVTATAQFVNSTFATTYRGVTQAMGTAFRSTWSAVQSSARNAGALVRGGLATLQHAGASAWRATTSCLGAGGACRTVLVVAAVVAVGIACTACMIGAAAGAALGGAFGAAFCPPQNKIGCIGRAALGGAVAGVTAPLGGGLLADAGLGARTIAVISGFTSGIAAEGSAQFVAGDFDAKRLAVAGASGAIVAGAIATAAPAARSLLGRARGTAVAERLPQDIGVNPEPPPAKRLNRPIGLSATQNAAVQRDIVELQAMRASDIRVNQQQVNAAGVRVGTNRPDLQYTLDGKRFYVEYERPGSPRWPGHQARLEANDPAGVATMKEQR